MAEQVFLSALHSVPHEYGNHIFRLGGVLYGNLHQISRLRIHGRIPKLFGAHFPQAFVPLYLIAFAHLFNLGRQFLIVVSVFHHVALVNFIGGRHTDIDVPRIDERPHITEKER